MARKVRIEYGGAFYHVINRGNYRSWIIETEGARKRFLKCVEEASVALARHLREGHLPPHRWIASNLQMGSPSNVQSLVSRHRTGKGCTCWRIL